jgi:hypothetical protein
MSEVTDAPRTFFLVAADSGSRCKVGEIAVGAHRGGGPSSIRLILDLLSRERASSSQEETCGIVVVTMPIVRHCPNFNGLGTTHRVQSFSVTCVCVCNAPG